VVPDHHFYHVGDEAVLAVGGSAQRLRLLRPGTICKADAAFIALAIILSQAALLIQVYCKCLVTSGIIQLIDTTSPEE
jgi:hypothetical protein